MHNFSYVSKKEAAPYKNEIISLLKLVQKEVKFGWLDSQSEFMEQYKKCEESS